MKEFVEYRQDLILGASVYVWAPWGQYDPGKLVNLGTNRWTSFGLAWQYRWGALS